jgi:hypothetical protein
MHNMIVENRQPLYKAGCVNWDLPSEQVQNEEENDGNNVGYDLLVQDIDVVPVEFTTLLLGDRVTSHYGCIYGRPGQAHPIELRLNAACMG